MVLIVFNRPILRPIQNVFLTCELMNNPTYLKANDYTVLCLKEHTVPYISSSSVQKKDR